MGFHAPAAKAVVKNASRLGESAYHHHTERNIRYTIGWKRRQIARGNRWPQSSQTSSCEQPSLVVPRSSNSATSRPHSYQPLHHQGPPRQTDSHAVETEPQRSARGDPMIRDSLSDFVLSGIHSSSWEVFASHDTMRIAYVGTRASNLFHVIELHQGGPPFKLYPHPPIYPPLPRGFRELESAEGEWAKEHREIFALPPKDVRDQLIEAFFEIVHPTFPIIDECTFRKQYASLSAQPPLVLLHAILLVGARVCNAPRIMQTRHTLLSALFRRAKMVFDMRHESDRLNLVQAALLFTWHMENADTVSSNTYYWTGVACRIAFGIGLHRDLTTEPPNRMPGEDRRIFRRVWWTLFQVEIMSALEHGRPPMIHLEDFDQVPLTLDDFIEADGRMNTRLNFEYCSRNVDLCYIALGILQMTSPHAAKVPPLTSYNDLTHRLLACALDMPKGDSFSDLTLQLNYHNLVINLHRAERDTSGNPTEVVESRNLCNHAAYGILSAFDTIQRKEMLRQCHFTIGMALIAAGVQISSAIAQAIDSNSMLLASSMIPQLVRVYKSAEALSPYWPILHGTQKIFRILSDKYSGTLSGLHQGTNLTQLTAGRGFEDTDWTNFLEFQWPCEDTFAEQFWDTAV
jgi:transcriptional regulatory protein AMDR